MENSGNLIQLYEVLKSNIKLHNSDGMQILSVQEKHHENLTEFLKLWTTYNKKMIKLLSTSLLVTENQIRLLLGDT